MFGIYRKERSLISNDGNISKNILKSNLFECHQSKHNVINVVLSISQNDKLTLSINMPSILSSIYEFMILTSFVDCPIFWLFRPIFLLKTKKRIGLTAEFKYSNITIQGNTRSVYRSKRRKT